MALLSLKTNGKVPAVRDDSSLMEILHLLLTEIIVTAFMVVVFQTIPSSSVEQCDSGTVVTLQQKQEG